MVQLLALLAVGTLGGSGDAQKSLADAVGAARAKTSQIVVMSPPDQPVVPTAALLEAVSGPLQPGWRELREPFFAVVGRDRQLLLVSRQVREFADLALLPAALQSLTSLPKNRVFAMNALPEAAKAYLAEMIASRLPFHQRPDQPGFGSLPVMARPNLRLTLEANGEQVQFVLPDPEIARMSSEQRKELYAPLESKPLPLAKSEREMAAEVDRQVREGAGPGFRFRVLAFRQPGQKSGEAVSQALADYRTALESAQTAAELAAAPLQAELSRRFPGLVDAYPRNKEVSSFSPEERDGMKGMLESMRRLGQPVPKNIDAFLRAARIADASPGLTLGVGFAPDGDILGIEIWPR